jgi:hypothetical protein
MKIIEVENRFGPRKAFENVDPQYKEFREGIRVLPAPYFEDRRIMFIFIAEHQPGEPMWAEGGYEVRGPMGEFRAYYLDQLILHPEVIKRRYGKNVLKSNSGNRGRPSSGEKPVKVGGTGKRGRPAVSPELRKNQPYIPTGLPRGRRKKSE